MILEFDNEKIEKIESLLGSAVECVIVSQRIWDVFVDITPLVVDGDIRIFEIGDVKLVLTLTDKLRAGILFDPGLKSEVVKIMNDLGEAVLTKVEHALDEAADILLGGRIGHVKKPISYHKEEISAEHARRLTEVGFFLVDSSKSLSVYEMPSDDGTAIVRIEALRDGYKATFDISTARTEKETTMSDTKFDMDLFEIRKTEEGEIAVIDGWADLDGTLCRRIRAAGFKMRRGEGYVWRLLDSEKDNEEQLLAFTEAIDAASGDPRSYTKERDKDKEETTEASKREAASVEKTKTEVETTTDLDEGNPFADEPEVEEVLLAEEVVEEVVEERTYSVNLEVLELGSGEKTKTIVATDTTEYDDQVLVAMKGAGFKSYREGNYLWKSRPENLNDLVEELAEEGIQVMIPGYVGTRGSARNALREVLLEAGIEADPSGDRERAEFGVVKAIVTEEGMLEMHVDHDAISESSRIAVTTNTEAVSSFLRGAAGIGILNMEA